MIFMKVIAPASNCHLSAKSLAFVYRKQAIAQFQQYIYRHASTLKLNDFR
jgi:hypothetical protein